MADFYSCPPSSVVLRHLSLAGLVVLAGSLYPIPSRTRPLNSPAPMVLSLKAWKSRSLPGLPRTETPLHDDRFSKRRRGDPPAALAFGDLAYRKPGLPDLRHSIW